MAIAGWSSPPQAESLYLKSAPGLTARIFGGAGWSSPVARQAHNLKVVGSNPTPATNKIIRRNQLFSYLSRVQ